MRTTNYVVEAGPRVWHLDNSGNEEGSPHVVVQAHRGPRLLHLGDGNKRPLGVSLGLEEPAKVVVPFARTTQEGSMVGGVSRWGGREGERGWGGGMERALNPLQLQKLSRSTCNQFLPRSG